MILEGSRIYDPQNYPNSGPMAVMEEMRIFREDEALLVFNGSVLDSREGARMAALSVFPLHLDLGFQGAEFLQIAQLPADSLLSGLPVPGQIERIVYYEQPPSAEDLRHLRVHLQKWSEGRFRFDVFHAGSLTPYSVASVEGFRSVLWNPWKGSQAPTVREFLGDTEQL